MRVDSAGQHVTAGGVDFLVDPDPPIAATPDGRDPAVADQDVCSDGAVRSDDDAADRGCRFRAVDNGSLWPTSTGG